MTRINDRLLVQRVDDVLVVIDESAGAEVAFPADLAREVAMAVLNLGNRRMPEPMSREALVEVLDDIRERVHKGDSFEGHLEYLMPWSTEIGDPETDGPEIDFRVQGAYRIGNLMGQGGMRMIGKT